MQSFFLWFLLQLFNSLVFSTIFLISSNNAQEKPELQTQHTVLMQPDQYQFQSIGTNALPPGIHGSFLNGGPNSGPYPTALPQRLTQGKEPSINDVTRLGGGGSAKRWRYSISLFCKMGDKGEGGVKNLKKWVTSIMDGPLSFPNQIFFRQFFNICWIIRKWPSINDVTLFLRFLTPLSPLSPILLNRLTE